MSNKELVLDDELYKFYIIDDVLSIRSGSSELRHRSDIDIRRIIATRSISKSQDNTGIAVVLMIFGFLIFVAAFQYLPTTNLHYCGGLLLLVGMIVFVYRPKTAVVNIDVEGEELYQYSMKIEETKINVFQDKINEVRRQYA